MTHRHRRSSWACVAAPVRPRRTSSLSAQCGFATSKEGRNTHASTERHRRCHRQGGRQLLGHRGVAVRHHDHVPGACPREGLRAVPHDRPERGQADHGREDR
ncbi:hypothetical protein [Ralstonia phage phiITL-1]|uniref:Uncharacterized protein n=1 Tax=Ralstonia phage phiITL-1 TaxID=1597967 RepID=A0A0U1ZDK1_9CAUD|nr:hypothetical protein HOR02_gp06 [Ralstonia phage phiITL-1]AJT60791.1 hypothetical protein [Ralstonia phage phiITL-1]